MLKKPESAGTALNDVGHNDDNLALSPTPPITVKKKTSPSRFLHQQRLSRFSAFVLCCGPAFRLVKSFDFSCYVHLIPCFDSVVS